MYLFSKLLVNTKPLLGFRRNVTLVAFLANCTFSCSSYNNWSKIMLMLIFLMAILLLFTQSTSNQGRYRGLSFTIKIPSPSVTHYRHIGRNQISFWINITERETFEEQSLRWKRPFINLLSMISVPVCKFTCLLEGTKKLIFISAKLAGVYSEDRRKR